MPYKDPQKHKEYQKKYQAKYQLKNKEKLKEYRIGRREIRKEYQKQYRLKNKEKINEYDRQYRLNNKEEIVIKQKEQYETNKLLAIQQLGGKCIVCGESNPDKLEFNHINPRDKDVNITHILNYNINNKTLQDELAKCNLLCKLCHLKETKNQWLNGTFDFLLED